MSEKFVKEFVVSRQMAQEMHNKKDYVGFWNLCLKIMVHIGEEHYFTQDGKIHPKARIKAKRVDRTMV